MERRTSTDCLPLTTSDRSRVMPDDLNKQLADVGDLIKSQREVARMSVRRLADAAGVSNPYLSQIERGLRKPSAEILQQIAKALRISAESLYVQAGILDERDRDALEVHSAILTDPTINERQKQVLLQIYESFRKENGFAEGVPDNAAEAVAGEAAAVPPARERAAKKTVKKAATKTARKPSIEGDGVAPVKRAAKKTAK